MPKFDKKFIAKLKAPSDKDQTFYWADNYEGLGIKVTNKGKKTFVVIYDLPPTVDENGKKKRKQRRITLGDYIEGFYELEEAIQDLRQARNLALNDGVDPKEHRKTVQQKINSIYYSDTIQDFSEYFLKDYAPTKNSEYTLKSETRPSLKHIRKHLGHLKINEVAYPHLIAMKSAMVDKPYAFNNCHKTLKAIFKFAIIMGVLKDENGNTRHDNPVSLVDKYPSYSRSDALTWSSEDLGRLEKAILKEENPVLQAWAYILFNCGTRANETAQLKWENIILSDEDGLIYIPASTRKQPKKGKAKSLVKPLDKDTTQYLIEHKKWVIKKFGKSCKWVFPSYHKFHNNGAKHISKDQSKLWASITDTFNHDENGNKISNHKLHAHLLRHNYATFTGENDDHENNVEESLLSLLLGHKDKNSIKTYNKETVNQLKFAQNKFRSKVKS